MKKLFLLLFALMPILTNAQWLVTPNGVLVDSLTKEPYMIITREGTAEELYAEILKNVHSAFASPDDVVSTIDGSMISVRGKSSTPFKRGGITHELSVAMSVKIEFKKDRMRVSAQWLNVTFSNWAASSTGDPYTILVEGGINCFNKKGEIKNEKRYKIYNDLSNKFIERLLKEEETDDW